ncbi:MBL fold metallo-hydrolase [Streptosporangiaceae bacterium NEAU-GS5]|nr:MBL fold metallo-hydrolase [Streptosporangiaceae bacterium NEAU-GS5]
MGDAIRKPMPEMFPGGPFGDDDEWVLHFHCHLIRAAGRTILVDVGLGGPGSPAASWAPAPGRLLAELESVGVAPTDVDTVVITHLHSDHVSGAVADGVPTFPNAAHIVQRAEVDGASNAIRAFLDPIKDWLQIVTGSTQLAPGVSVVHTPGHTPGHQTVEIGSLVISGDVLHHPAQLVDPMIGYLYDHDPVQAAQTRAAVLTRAQTLAPAHLPDPFIPLR